MLLCVCVGCTYPMEHEHGWLQRRNRRARKGAGEKKRGKEDGTGSGWPNDVCMYTTNMSE